MLFIKLKIYSDVQQVVCSWLHWYFKKCVDFQLLSNASRKLYDSWTRQQIQSTPVAKFLIQSFNCVEGCQATFTAVETLKTLFKEVICPLINWTLIDHFAIEQETFGLLISLILISFNAAAN